MRRARFRVTFAAPLDGAYEGTVTVTVEDGGRSLIAVRPKRRRREYVLPFDRVAEWICWRVVQVEAREKAKVKAAARKERARLRRLEAKR